MRYFFSYLFPLFPISNQQILIITHCISKINKNKQKQHLPVSQERCRLARRPLSLLMKLLIRRQLSRRESLCVLLIFYSSNLLSGIKSTLYAFLDKTASTPFSHSSNEKHFDINGASSILPSSSSSIVRAHEDTADEFDGT